MKIEAFVLCDAATDSQGKLNILGTFDTIYAKKVPTVHPQCALALRLRLNRSEGGNHKLAMHIINADGKPVIPPFEGGFDVSFKGDDLSAAINIIMNIQSMPLELYGEYAARLMIDGNEMTSLPIYVKPAPQN